MKVETRKRHQHELRRAMAVSEYLMLTATDLHRQATEFIDKLEEKYPGKRDVRKTPEFRNWQRVQLLKISKQSSATDQTPRDQDSTNSKKEMVLRIPLMHDSTNAKPGEIPADVSGTKAKQTPSVLDMPGETQEDGLSSIFDEIPPDVMNEMMTEIRADPELSAIINDFDFYEEVVGQGTVPENIGLDDIEIDDRLEDELNSLLYF